MRAMSIDPPEILNWRRKAQRKLLKHQAKAG
jgi:hypothetical protein